MPTAKIDKLRNELYDLIDLNGQNINSTDVITLSQKLDELLVKFIIDRRKSEK